MQAKLVVVGSLNYDLVTYTRIVPEGGETIHAEKFETHCGGKGLNEAIALSRLLPKERLYNEDSKISNVRMIGKVGDDIFGKELIEKLEINRVDTSLVKIENNSASGIATILVETETGENRILVTPGANGKLKFTNEEIFNQLFPAMEKNQSQFILLQNEFPDPYEVMKWLSENRPKFTIAYNPSPYDEENSIKKFLKYVDLLIVNDLEAKSLVSDLEKTELSNGDQEEEARSWSFLENKENAKETCSKILQEMKTSSIHMIVVTLGCKGACFGTFNKNNANETNTLEELIFEYVKPLKVEHVVDTTGAGDTFFGGLVSQLSINNKDYKRALKFATCASALAIQKNGASDSIPYYEDVMKLLE